MSGVEASTLFALASVSSSVGTMANIQSQRAAMARENYRIETERRMARLRALEEENAREEMLQNALANNLAYQSIAGFSDDSRSFLNINNVAIKKAEKDIANIRLMGKNINNKYTSMIAENKYKEQDLIFGGYVSVITELTTGYANYKYYKEPKRKSKPFAVNYDTAYGSGQ